MICPCSAGKGKHDANEMKRLLMPHMLDDDDITIEVMVIHYKKDPLYPATTNTN